MKKTHTTTLPRVPDSKCPRPQRDGAQSHRLGSLARMFGNALERVPPMVDGGARTRVQMAGSSRAAVALFAVLSFVAAPSFAASLKCEGVLGNSGEQGAALVRFGTEPAKGMGVAYDRFGSLWDRGGAGVLNRYALDGRLLRTYRIRKGTGR